MSFSKIISIFAGLGSIFVVSATGFKLSQNSQIQNSPSQEVQSQSQYEERIIELQKQISSLQERLVEKSPPVPLVLPEPSSLKPIQPPLPPPSIEETKNSQQNN